MTAACITIGTPRDIVEAAAERDPDTYVPLLDTADLGSEDLECDEAEPGDEDQDHGALVWIASYCPCCGSHIGTEEWLT